MRIVAAILRASWLGASSYRLEMLISVASLVLTVIPMYFVGGALQPIAGRAIAEEGGHYFSFLVAGTVAMLLAQTAVMSLPGAVGGALRNGTLEAILATPAPLPAVLAGMTSYGMLWTAVRALLIAGGAMVLGATFSGGAVLPSLVLLALVIVAYAGLGLMFAALVLAFRTAGPLPRATIVASTLLGGVYYPTSVIPSWIQELSAAVPLTYGLRAMRRLALDGASIADVTGDATRLALFAAGLSVAGALAFATALRHARRAGTLAQY